MISLQCLAIGILNVYSVASFQTPGKETKNHTVPHNSDANFSSLMCQVGQQLDPKQMFCYKFWMQNKKYEQTETHLILNSYKEDILKIKFT